MVEVVTAVIGAAAIMLVENIVPYALSFPAGAMIYVVFDDIMPEAHKNNNKRLVSISVIIGFMLMMCLEVGLEHGHSHGGHDH
jgi:zinc transporter ZupT